MIAKAIGPMGQVGVPKSHPVSVSSSEETVSSMGGLHAHALTQSRGGDTQHRHIWQNADRVRRSRFCSVITTAALATGLTALAALPAPASAEETRRARQVAHLTDAGANTVSAIDVATNTTIATIPVGTATIGVAASPGGTRVYVTNFRWQHRVGESTPPPRRHRHHPGRHGSPRMWPSPLGALAPTSQTSSPAPCR